MYGIYIVKPVLMLEGIDEEKTDKAMEDLRKSNVDQDDTFKNKNMMRIFKTENKAHMDWFEK